MYDLWFTLGSAIMDPGLLDAVENSGPVFQRVERRTTEPTTGFDEINTTTAGLLQSQPTTSVRQAIAAFLRTKSVTPPPVSIFTAGKLCQFLTIPEIGIREAIGAGNTAFQKVAQASAPLKAPSQGFVAILGLCLVDPGLVFLIKNPDQDADASAHGAAVEFGLSAFEWGIIGRFVTQSDFAGGQQRLFNTPQFAAFDPWIRCCGEQFVFWNGQNDRAVL
jgi:hypothetical protein